MDESWVLSYNDNDDDAVVIVVVAVLVVVDIFPESIVDDIGEDGGHWYLDDFVKYEDGSIILFLSLFLFIEDGWGLWSV